MSEFFFFVLGIATTGATFYLFGQWLRWRGTIEFRDEAEQRLRDLDPLSDDWQPHGSWPRRVK